MAHFDPSRLNGWGLWVLRITVGAVFLVHGLQKVFVFGVGGVAGYLAQQGFPAPGLLAFVLSAGELAGGVALLLGLFTRAAAIGLAITMVLAIFTVHLKSGFFMPAGFEYALSLLGASISIALTGARTAAVDVLIRRRFSR